MIPPFFSIVIPLYNKGPFIQKTLDSVLNQKLQDYEVIVVNDGSIDDGAALVQQYVQREPRIRLVDQDNGGVSRARNRGISEARGRYVAFLDADDWWEPQHLTELKALATEFPQAGLIGTAYVRRLAKPPHVASVVRALRGKRGVIDDYFKICTECQFIYTSSIAIPLHLLRQLQHPFPPDVRRGQDIDLWTRVAACHPVAYSGFITVNYNCNVPGQTTGKSSSYRGFSPQRALTLITLLEQNPQNRSLRRYAEKTCLNTIRIFFQFRPFPIQDFRSYVDQSRFSEWVTHRTFRFLCGHPTLPIWRLYFRLYGWRRKRIFARIFRSRTMIDIICTDCGGCRPHS